MDLEVLKAINDVKKKIEENSRMISQLQKERYYLTTDRLNIDDNGIDDLGTIVSNYDLAIDELATLISNMEDK